MNKRTFALKAFALAALCLLATTARAQTETWAPAEPRRVVPERLAVYTCDGQTRVAAYWVFSTGGFRVIQTPLVSRSGQTVTLDARVENWTGAVTLSLVPFEKTFELGALEPGDYTLDFRSWGAPLKQAQFTVPREAPVGREIDRPCFFVSQHYRDFLSREPDAGGLAFWSNELHACGADAQCREVRKINVSAAFFLSIEFQQTGYFVYRVYKAALGRAPSYAEFGPDAARVGHHVVVGSNDPWALRLSYNKDAFAQEFAGRQEFLARYEGLTHAQYVDKLFETAGLAPSQQERDALVAGLTACGSSAPGCLTRAAVLRKVAEHPSLDRKLFNEAFVTMQYFGYLRRDPDDGGFRFWLSKLEQFGGNFVEAEMVKAFISSDEYLRRFGQP